MHELVCPVHLTSAPHAPLLPADMWLLWDKSFRKYVDLYAKDQDKFFDDFAAAFSKLLELGVPFDKPAAAAASPKPQQ